MRKQGILAGTLSAIVLLSAVFLMQTVKGQPEIPAAKGRRTVELPTGREETDGQAEWRTTRQAGIPGEAAAGGALVMDLNFDGYEDRCYQAWFSRGVNIPYNCMLWNPESRKYEYAATLYNVETDTKKQLVISRMEDEDGLRFVTSYRFGGDDQLYMVSRTEEDSSSDAVFEYLELTYVDADDEYTLPTPAVGEISCGTIFSMAKQALEELYRWTGVKVEKACFQVNDLGGVHFALTEEDMMHSRIFYSRYFGAETDYNLDGCEKSVSSVNLVSGRTAWYSPIFWSVFPEEMEHMTDEEIVIWYFERSPAASGDKAVSVRKSYEDTWTIGTEAGSWFEVIYHPQSKEVDCVTGPYSAYPEH